MIQNISLVTVVGNPKAHSRTLSAAAELAGALAEEIGQDAGIDSTTIDLAEIVGGLLAPWSLSEAAETAVAQVKSADVLILATPTYKASFTGVLKLLLDTLPAGSLSRTVVIPLTVSAGPAHRYLADWQLRPVLGELGAVIPTPSFLLAESELPEVAALAKTFAVTYGSTVRAVLSARS